MAMHTLGSSAEIEVIAAATAAAARRGEVISNTARLVLASAGLVVLLTSVGANAEKANTVLWTQDLVWFAWGLFAHIALRRRGDRGPGWLAAAGIMVDQLVIAGTYVAASYSADGATGYWQGSVLVLFSVVNVVTGVRLSPGLCVLGAVTTLVVNSALLAHSIHIGALATSLPGALSQGMRLPDAVIAIVVASLTGFGVAVVAHLSRGLLERAELETAARNAIADEYARLAKYLPREVVEVVMRDPLRRQLGGQRCLATIAFVDILNFTAMTEKMEPEDTVTVLNMFFAEMVGRLFKYNGTLDKYLGDGFMAVFGAPLHLDDAPTRAVAAAVEMVRAARDLAAVVPGGSGLRIGVAIATGEVLSGTIGSRERMEFTCIGAPVNLASRLEGLNPLWGTSILIDQATRAGLAPQWPCVARGSVPLRGLTDNVEVFAVEVAEINEPTFAALTQGLRAGEP